MLSKLRQENQELRDKLRRLRLNSARFNAEFNNLSRYTEFPEQKHQSKGSVLDDYCQQRYNMLSDRVKIVRGEASKRIGVLLQDWKDFKEKTEEDLRRRARSEQHLKDLLLRRDREIEELTYELSSYRALTIEQKNTVEQLLEERENNKEYKAKCSELEIQSSKLNRRMNEISNEIQSRDELLQASEAEKESLLSLNSELRHVNAEQKKKLDICERDVNETRLELEMLEDLVQALSERKSALVSLGSDPTRDTTRRSPTNFFDEKNDRVYAMSDKSKVTDFSPKLSSTVRDMGSKKTRFIPISLTGETQKLSAGHLSTSTSSSSDRAEVDSGNSDKYMDSKKSALSALKSLQKDHNDKCSFLAEHIKKLKQQNKEKENRLQRLQNSGSSQADK